MALDHRPTELDELRRWCLQHGGVGFIDGNLWHEWHGDSKNRHYMARNDLLRGIDRDRDLEKRPDGLLQWSASADPGLRQRVRQYFNERLEDGPQDPSS